MQRVLCLRFAMATAIFEATKMAFSGFQRN